MFLIRTAFWLTLIILLLPTNEQEQRNVYGTAEAAVKDMKSFCTRNPQVCEKSSEALDIFAQKAQFGAKMVMDFISDVSASTGTQENVRPRRLPTLFNRESQNTLTEEDKQLTWSGPSSNERI